MSVRSVGVEALSLAFMASAVMPADAESGSISPEDLTAEVQDAARRVWHRPDDDGPPATKSEALGRDAFAVRKGDQRRRFLARLVGHLLNVGVDPTLCLAIAQGDNIARNEPPLHPAKVEGLVDWVLERDADRLEGRG